MSVSEEHVKLLKQQNALVAQLKEVLATQQRALEELGALDEDYEGAAVREYPGCDSDNEAELELLDAHAARAASKPEAAEEEEGEDSNQDATWEAPEEGAVSNKPWLGSMKPPSNWSADEAKVKAREAAPTGSLVLDHVYGYRSRGCRNNIAYAGGDTIVYPAGSVCVISNMSKGTQSFFRGHTGEVLCLDFNPIKRLAASGEHGPRPKVCVWSVDNPQEVRAEFMNHRRAVVSVAISPDGNRLISVGLDNDHCTSVHDLNTGMLVAQCKGGPSRILSARWNLTTAVNNCENFVTVGAKHLTFWEVTAEGAVERRKALLGRKGEWQNFLSVCFTPKNTVVGGESGHLYLFEENKLKHTIAAHNKACFAVDCDITTGRLVSGGRDGFVNVFDVKETSSSAAERAGTPTSPGGTTSGKKTFTPPQRTDTIDLNAKDTACNGLNSIKAVYLDPQQPDSVLVGTISNTIYQVGLAGDNQGQLTKVAEGHYGDLSKANSYGEVMAVATHPSTHQFVTCGEDKCVRAWDAETKKCLKTIDVGSQATCAAYHPSGSYYAVGLKSGAFTVFSSGDNVEVARIRKSKKRVQCIRYSPDGTTLAIGTAKNAVHLFTVSKDGAEYTSGAVLEGHCSVILHMDFTSDSKILQTCSQAYELLFYDVASAALLDRSGEEAKDLDWATFTSTLGWNVQGLWGPHCDGSSVLQVDKNPDGTLLATADESGSVRLFQYPCVGSGFNKEGNVLRQPHCLGTGPAHGSHVTGVKFSHDGKYLFSSAGDQAVMQWRYTS